MHHLDRRGTELTGLITLTAVLQLAGAAGISYVAGFSDVGDRMSRITWPWLLVLLGGLVISFAGYYFAYHGVYSVEHGKSLSRPQMRAVVTAGFAGFLAHGGTILDVYAVQATGATHRRASVRVAALAGLEHGVLAVITSVAAIAALVAVVAKPPLDFTLPWATIPVPGFLLAFWLAERHRERLRRRGGWRGKVGVFLDSIHLVRLLFRRPLSFGAAPFAMAVFWAADMFALWASMRAFGFGMDVAALIVGYSTGMVFTRRTGPFAGAGVIMLLLPLTLWYSGAPLAAAVAGVFAYRVISLWLPLPFSLAALPTLREIGKAGTPHAEGEAHADEEPALRRNVG
jgi:uncharacterized membrane protein YbhN (UPF0104 family)